MRKYILPVGMAVIVLGGCGGGDGGSRPTASATGTAAATAGDGAAAPTGSASATPTGTAPPADLTAAERAPAGVADRYLRAMVAGDYEAACATRAPREQARLAELGGTCPKALETAVAAREDEVKRLFEDVTARRVTVRGDRAAIAVYDPDEATPVAVFVARRDGNRWGLVDVDDAKAEQLLNG